ncbi:MAG TPA: TIGR03067 domain-containing protein [Candidatus Sulfopaludibacter sp.]|jgi:uncharacterized protein (TIGR03067 family)|nr:TIGR03067 domain-containing protein [Candidatus Sulfopaludibacter sp.]
MKGDLKKLQGAWNMMTLEMEGQQYPTGNSRIVIQGERFVSLNMGAEYEGSFAIDETQTPRTLDLLFDKGPESGSKSLGIYEVDGDTWKLCLGLTGKSRPKKFAAEKGTGHALEVLQRESAEDRAAAGKRSGIDESAAPVAELDGEWFMVSCMQDGKPIHAQFLKAARRVFKGNGTTLFAGKQAFMKSTFAVDTQQTPHAIDYPDQRQLGIYQVDGSTLRTSMAAAGAPRPADFSTAKGDGRTVSEWSRERRR